MMEVESTVTMDTNKRERRMSDSNEDAKRNKMNTTADVVASKPPARDLQNYPPMVDGQASQQQQQQQQLPHVEYDVLKHPAKTSRFIEGTHQWAYILASGLDAKWFGGAEGTIEFLNRLFDFEITQSLAEITEATVLKGELKEVAFYLPVQLANIIYMDRTNVNIKVDGVPHVIKFFKDSPDNGPKEQTNNVFQTKIVDRVTDIGVLGFATFREQGGFRRTAGNVVFAETSGFTNSDDEEQEEEEEEAERNVPSKAGLKASKSVPQQSRRDAPSREWANKTASNIHARDFLDPKEYRAVTNKVISAKVADQRYLGKLTVRCRPHYEGRLQQGVPLLEETFAHDLKAQMPHVWDSVKALDYNSYSDELEIVFTNQEAKDELCRTGLDTHNVRLEFTPMVQSTTFMTLWDLPAEMPNSEVKDVFTAYGDVLRVWQPTRQVIDKVVESKKRLMRIRMKEIVPRYVNVLGCRAKTQYTGQREALDLRRKVMREAVQEAVVDKLVDQHTQRCSAKSMPTVKGTLQESYWHPEHVPEPITPGDNMETEHLKTLQNEAIEVKKKMEEAKGVFDKRIHVCPAEESMQDIMDNEHTDFVLTPVTPPVLAAFVEHVGSLTSQTNAVATKRESDAVAHACMHLEFGSPDAIDLRKMDEQIQHNVNNNLHEARYPDAMDTWRNSTTKFGNKRETGYTTALELLNTWYSNHTKCYIKLDNEEMKLKREQMKKEREEAKRLERRTSMMDDDTTIGDLTIDQGT